MPVRRRRWPAMVVGVVAVVALLGTTIGVWVVGGRDGTDPAARHDEPARDDADAGHDLPPATPDELRATIDEISAFVAEERGLDFLEPVDVELVADAEFQDRVLEDFDEGVEDLSDTETVLKGLGLVDPDVDLAEAMRALLGGGVVGFFDPETHELVVRGAALTPYVRTTIAHELAHALDDQHFGLHRPDYDDADDEIGFGFSAVVEGNARRIEAAYQETFSEGERRAAYREELDLGAGFDFAAIPPVLIDLIGAPYALGELFVGEVIAEGGQQALDEAFEAPPRTSEQVMDPPRYFAGEKRIEVTPPDVPGKVVTEGVTGQLLLFLVLAEHLDIEQSRQAASGWGGDWAVGWRDDDRPCVTLAVVGDTAVDTDELRTALQSWADEHGHATVTAGAGGTVTLASCAAA